MTDTPTNASPLVALKVAADGKAVHVLPSAVTSVSEIGDVLTEIRTIAGDAVRVAGTIAEVLSILFKL